MNTILVLIARRAAGHWRLMCALALGFVIAVGLMSATVLYADALDDLGLDFALARANHQDLHVVVSASSRLNPSEATPVLQTIEGGFDGQVGRFTVERIRYLKSGTFYPTAPGGAVNLRDEQRPRAYLQSRSRVDQHVRVSGRAPSATADESRIEVAIGAPAAARLGVPIGAEFDLHPFWDEKRAPVRAVVVGIFEQLDPGAGYWAAAPDVFDHRTTSWATYALFVNERALVDGLGAALGDVPGDITVVGVIDTDALQARDSGAIQAAMGGYRGYLEERVKPVTIRTTLPQLLHDFEARLRFSRIPLLVLIIQIVGIAIYYLVMIASMLVERQAGEIALLKSRGGTTLQIMAIYLIEGLALAGVALAAGPPLASAVVAFLGKTSIFSDLSGGAALQAPLTIRVYAVAAGGAILALAALLLPAWLATRNTIVHYKQSLGRSDTTPLFFRYYFDLFFVVLLGVLFFELRHRGSLATQDLFGELEADPLLLLSPAVFLITAGVVFLRAFPLLLRLVSGLLGRMAFTPPLVAMWHLVRNPTHYGRLVLLLILASSLGMFAAGFGSTLNTNYSDRALYEAGADARLVDLRPAAFPPAVYYQALDHAPGVDRAAAVLRDDVSYRKDSFRTVSGALIGIDDRFGEVAFFRRDFAPDSLAAILRGIQAGQFIPPEAPAVQGGDTWLSLWVHSGPSIGPHELYAQVRDSAGQGRDVRLLLPLPATDRPRPASALNAPPAELDWHRYNGPFPADLKPPLTVHGISFRRPGQLGADRGRLVVDELASFVPAQGDAEPTYHLVSSFEQAGQWERVDGLSVRPLADELVPTPTLVHDGAAALQLSWTEPVSSFVQRGFRIRGGSEPLPVYASENFLAESGLSKGDRFVLGASSASVPCVIAGSLTYFPTIADPAATPFLVADLARYAYLVNRAPGTVGGVAATEIWLSTDSSTFELATAQRLLPAIPATTVLATEVSAGREQDPLAAAGWQGILAIAFGAVLLLSAVGFVVYSYLSAHARRLEFAILRTLGLTRLQVAGVVATEQAIVVGVGTIAGSLVGLRLGPLMIDYLGITETGADVVPPYRSVTDWFTVATTYGTLAAVFLGATLLIIALYSRLAIHRVLRLGEL